MSKWKINPFHTNIYNILLSFHISTSILPWLGLLQLHIFYIQYWCYYVGIILCDGIISIYPIYSTIFQILSIPLFLVAVYSGTTSLTMELTSQQRSKGPTDHTHIHSSTTISIYIVYWHLLLIHITHVWYYKWKSYHFNYIIINDGSFLSSDKLISIYNQLIQITWSITS